MTKITTLFLDIGGVLLTNGWDRNGRKAACTRFKLEEDEVDERHHLMFDTYEIGKMSLDDYLKEVIFFKTRIFTIEDFKNFMFSLSKADDNMLQLIKDIKKKYGLKIGTLSNEGPGLTEYRLNNFHLKEFVDFFVMSCFAHFKKPDLDIYRLALDISQANPSEIIYIDDRSLFVEIGTKLGIHSIQHVNYEKTKFQLEKLLEK